MANQNFKDAHEECICTPVGWLKSAFMHSLGLSKQCICTPMGNCCSRSPVSARLGLSILGMVGYLFVYALRINMSMAIVCMVNSTVEGQTQNESFPSVPPGGDDCGELESEAPSFQGEFSWDKDLQGHIMSSFFYGYMVIQVPAGWLSGRYGGKIVYIIGMTVATIATLLLPVCARASVYLVITMRVIIGIGTGVSFPAMNSLWGKWAPPLERSKLMTFCNAGTTLGNILTLSLSGLLCAVDLNGSSGWPLIFYVFGAASIIWLISWTVFAYDSPKEHPCMSEDERNYIVSSIGSKITDEDQDLSVPWISIMKSLPLWAILTAHVCNNWGGYLLLTSLPKYMAEVLKFDIKANGLLSAMPYMVQTVTAILGGQLADCLRERKVLSTTNTRKVFQVISFLGQAAFIIAAGFVTCGQRAIAVVLFALAVGFTFGSRSGYAINHVDIAPRHAGILYGITNTVATVPGIIAPIVVGKLTPNGLREEWQIVFYITGGVFAVGAIVYAIFASGEEQAWAKNKNLIQIENKSQGEVQGTDNPAVDIETKF